MPTFTFDSLFSYSSVGCLYANITTLRSIHRHWLDRVEIECSNLTLTKRHVQHPCCFDWSIAKMYTSFIWRWQFQILGTVVNWRLTCSCDDRRQIVKRHCSLVFRKYSANRVKLFPILISSPSFELVIRTDSVGLRQHVATPRDFILLFQNQKFVHVNNLSISKLCDLRRQSNGQPRMKCREKMVFD